MELYKQRKKVEMKAQKKPNLTLNMVKKRDKKSSLNMFHTPGGAVELSHKLTRPPGNLFSRKTDKDYGIWVMKWNYIFLIIHVSRPTPKGTLPFGPCIVPLGSV